MGYEKRKTIKFINMEQKTNIAELLKDCPKGMELDCTMYENVTFEEVVSTIDCDGNEDVNIILLTHYNDGADDAITLTNYGTYTYNETAKCVIFPKGKTTWEGFVPPCKFKDGDIIFTNTNALKCDLENSWVSIFKEYRNNRCACYVCLCLSDLELYHDKWEDELLCELCEIEENRLATEEEKQKLLTAIKANGYKWNPETKTLEKLIEPKFKVGDKIKHKITNKIGVIIYILNNGENGGQYDIAITNEIGISINIETQDDWELLPNKFDITTLKPFDKVLCRDSFEDTWTTGFYSHFETTELSSYYVVNGTGSDQCIPYNKDTKHLIGTTNDCDDYYKTWE